MKGRYGGFAEQRKKGVKKSSGGDYSVTDYVFIKGREAVTPGLNYVFAISPSTGEGSESARAARSTLQER
jgi:hypothetical protein